VKEQYVGDVNDYRKYALLRALADGGRTKIGVAWMLTPPDGRPDGNMLAYLEKPSFRTFDPGLFDLMRQVSSMPKSLERSPGSNTAVPFQVRATSTLLFRTISRGGRPTLSGYTRT
jgi:hypothetical protein